MLYCSYLMLLCVVSIPHTHVQRQICSLALLSMDAFSINSITLYNNAIRFAKNEDRLNDGIELWVQFSLSSTTIDWLVDLLIVVGGVAFSFSMCRLDHKMPALVAFLYWQV